MKKFKIVDILLRIAVAFAFLYPPISALFNPYSWVGYFPPMVTTYIPFDSILLLHLFGAFEFAIAIWLLFGKKIFFPSLISALFLFAIIVFNLSQMDVLFRDIPILLIAISLMLLHAPKAEAT